MSSQTSVTVVLRFKSEDTFTIAVAVKLSPSTLINFVLKNPRDIALFKSDELYDTTGLIPCDDLCAMTSSNPPVSVIHVNVYAATDCTGPLQTTLTLADGVRTATQDKNYDYFLGLVNYSRLV